MGRLLVALSFAAGVLAVDVPAGGATERRERSLPTPQVGMATYYASRFDGDRTASGVRFDNDRLFAAHRRYPFGTIVRVTNLKNGRHVTVRIVDRGPYGDNHREGTIIDLSLAAARQLRMLRDGQVLVRVRVLRWGRRQSFLPGPRLPSSRSRSNSDAGSFPTSLNFAAI